MEQGKPLSETESPLVDFDAVCQKVRAAVEPMRLHAVSLHDEKGDVLWLTESSMGPDEHNAVREAFEAFTSADGPPVLDYDLGDSRSAVLFSAVNSRRSLVGALMMIMDTRGIKQDTKGPSRLMNPKLQRALSEFVGMRQVNDGSSPVPRAAPMPAATRAPNAPRAAGPVELTLADSMRFPKPAPQAAVAAPTRAPAVPAAVAPPAPSTTAAPAPVRAAAPVPLRSPAAAPVRAPAAVPVKAPAVTSAAAATDKRSTSTPAVTPEIDRLHAALRRSPIALHVQRLVPLSKGSQLKRYEVLLRSKSDDAPNAAPHAMLKAAVEHGLGSMIDRRVVTELIGWLVHHPEVWKTHAVMFSVNLTSTALLDEHFIKFVDLCLQKSSLPKAMIAFEIDVATAIQHGDRMVDVAAALHRLTCPLVLDDFGMRTECFDLLRLPAVRYVKLATQMTAKMRSDKLSQAAITAVVQMSRVLGMHTVAKRTETAAEQEWLTALGVDFIQSNALSPSVSIESLSKTSRPKN